MNTQVSFCGRRVVTNVTSVRFVATFVLLATAQTWMRRVVQTIYTLLFKTVVQIGRVLLSHVYVQRFTIFIMPIALGTLQLLASVARVHGRSTVCVSC